MLALRRAFDAVVSRVVVWMLIVLLAVMTTQVVLRYGFSASLIWAEETSRYLLIWVSFLSVVLAYERGEIASVPMLRDALPRRAGLVLAMIANVCGIVLLAVLVWYGLVYANRLGSAPIPAMKFLLGDLFGPAFPTPTMYWVYVALPIGLTILALRLAVDVILYGRMIGTGEYAADLRDGGVPEGHP
ncbi:TRAP transporter small permease [Aquibium microcysteis]|uniref:TRAP transporter small permease n=1 Tax=Aquibium microcysteis TaxID=675281 RepID=UPI00165CF55F|nr:TRAP transporter small permease [Aquibium microcysteis]